MKINQRNASISKTNDPPPISDNPLRILCYITAAIEKSSAPVHEQELKTR